MAKKARASLLRMRQDAILLPSTATSLLQLLQSADIKYTTVFWEIEDPIPCSNTEEHGDRWDIITNADGMDRCLSAVPGVTLKKTKWLNCLERCYV